MITLQRRGGFLKYKMDCKMFLVNNFLHLYNRKVRLEVTVLSVSLLTLKMSHLLDKSEINLSAAQY